MTDNFEDVPLLPPEFEEEWASIKQPFGGLFGNSVVLRVLREIVADPHREFRPKDLEILASATPPSIKKALDTLTALNLLVKDSHDTQRPFYRVKLESNRLMALTFLTYAITDDRDGTDCMDVAIMDYCDERYGPHAINNIKITYDAIEVHQAATGKIETDEDQTESIDVSTWDISALGVIA